jgi:hypothetical protein
MIETPSIFKQILQNPLLILKSPVSMGNLGTKRVSIISLNFWVIYLVWAQKGSL